MSKSVLSVKVVSSPYCWFFKSEDAKKVFIDLSLSDLDLVTEDSSLLDTSIEPRFYVGGLDLEVCGEIGSLNKKKNRLISFNAFKHWS